MHIMNKRNANEKTKEKKRKGQLKGLQRTTITQNDSSLIRFDFLYNYLIFEHIGK